VSPNKHLILLSAFAVSAMAWSAPVEAQGRGRGRPAVFVRAYYADPFWFDPWYGFPYAFAPLYPPYWYGPAEPGSAVRLEVTPREAEVYVDGYYAGVVDDFNGFFQRLHVSPGEHEITLYEDGYRTVRQKVYLTPDATFKIRYKMERLAPGEATDPRPAPASLPSAPPTAAPYPPRGPVGRRLPPTPPPPPQAPPDQERPRTADRSSYGTLSIRVQPANVRVLIDGNRWQGPEDQDRLLVEVAEGSHRVEIDKEGYESFSADVQVRRGEATPLNVNLRVRQ
jgi:hypothetical protein